MPKVCIVTLTFLHYKLHNAHTIFCVNFLIQAKRVASEASLCSNLVRELLDDTCGCDQNPCRENPSAGNVPFWAFNPIPKLFIFDENCGL